MELAYSLTVALFLTIALMPVAMRLAPRLGLLDKPDANRKQHAHSIPRSGGIAMAIGIAIPLVYFSSLYFGDHTRLLASLFIGAAIIIIFGVLDDRYNLDYRWKFIGQIVASLIVLIGGVTMQRLPLFDFEAAPTVLSCVVSFFFILGVTNAVNLTDGLDGLAGGSSLLTLSAIALIGLLAEDMLSTLIALTAIGGVLGFLRFNTYPAQIFMGDTGSQLLGFLSACLAILVSQHDTAPVSPALPLLLLGLPVLDTLTVMTIRLREGRSPFSPDRNHLHHQIIALGFRHNEAVAIIYLLQILLLSLAFFFRYAEDWILLTIYALFCAILLGSLKLARLSQWRFHTQEAQRDHIDRRNFLLRKMKWFYLNSAYIIQVAIAAALTLPLVSRDSPHSFINASIALTASFVIFLLARGLTPWITRLFVYPASAFSAYLLSTSTEFSGSGSMINALFVALACLLALAIRMTRREQFRLDTQDLLILLIVVTVPLLPIESVSRHAVGEIVLRLCVLMYSCEFVLGRTQGRHLAPLGCMAGFVLFYTLLPV